MNLTDLIQRREGVLRLRPQFVRRFYPDLNRLGQKKLKRSPRQFIPERWIGSSVEAINPPPMPGGGLSRLDVPGRPLSLRDAIESAPLEMLGEELFKRHGAEFRVLVKLLDPGEAIVFHLHATDAQVKRLPRHFPGHRFGKDEAYYFLEAPKGPMPYTHAGLHDGVTRREMIDAVQKGPEHALELSPSFYQEHKTGFFVPAGVPHRPGTALTLEIQQPSDVYTLLETHAAGKPLSPEQIHPGFERLADAFSLIDLKASRAVGRLEQYRLSPMAAGPRAGWRGSSSGGPGGSIDWVFPPEVCGKFAGLRLRVETQMTFYQQTPMVMWFWRGRGRLSGRGVRRGDEFFITPAAARGGLELRNTGEELLEAFAFFPI